jgi:hypothetical protein
MPPAEIAVHPTDGPPLTEMHLVCDDIEGTIAELHARGAQTTGPPGTRSWGLATGLRLPSGGVIGLYEARHASSLGL